MKFILMIAVAALTAAASAQLAQSWMASGNVEGQVVGDTDPTFSGNYSLVVGGMPSGAAVQKAFLYANEWNNTTTATATFAGNNLGTISAFTSDNGLDVYRWDVTGLIAGNGTYAATILGPLQNNGIALALVYMEPSLPQSTVELHDGAWNLGDFGAEQQSTIFAVFPGGAGTLSIYTQGDDNAASGETVKFNGANVGGPLDGNLGTHASILNIGVTVLSGTNTAAIHTPSDQFGWHVAMLNNPVPEPATFAALALGVLLFRRRRKSSLAP